MWSPFRKDEKARQELFKIDKRIAYHRGCFNGMCKMRKGLTEKAFIHQQLFHLWEARRVEFRAKHLFGRAE